MISKQMESCAPSFKTLAFRAQDFQKKQIKFKQIAHETSLHFKKANVFFFVFFSAAVIQDAKKKKYI